MRIIRPGLLFITIMIFLSCNLLIIKAGRPDTLNNNAQVLSRNSGKAPLYVFFDTTGIFNDDNYLNSTIVWNFDLYNQDDNGRHETASGFTASHVYEAPGTYTARAEIYNRSNQLNATRTYEITVEPWEGDKIYVASDGDDRNPGTLELPIATIEEALLNRAVSGRQIFFRRGDTFEFSDKVVTKIEGPILVSSYVDSNNPSTEKPVLYAGANNASYILQLRGSDWRFTDLHFLSDGIVDISPGCFSTYVGDYKCNQTLLLDLEVEGFSASFSLNGDQNAVFDSSFHNIGTYGTYSSHGSRASLVGNKYYDIGYIKNEHVVRFQSLEKGFIAFNHFQGSHTKSCLQIRGNSSKVVIYSNVLDRTSGMNPQNGTSEEYIHHCVFDSNLLIGRTSPDWSNDFPLSFIGLSIKGKDLVVRNNIFYNFSRAISITEHPLVGNSERISLLNNTLLSNSAIYLRYTDQYHRVQNNLHYTKDSEGRFLQFSGNQFNGNFDYNLVWGNDEGRFTVIGPDKHYSFEEWKSYSGYETHSQVTDPFIGSIDLLESLTENPDFRTQDLRSLGLFQPMSGSPVIDNGRVNGTVLDFFGNKRDDKPDIGAIEAF